MSDEPSTRTGQIAATPEGGPLTAGGAPSPPGSGQVQITPEAGPLIPPTLRDHMQGPILGLDDIPPETSSPTSTHPSPSALGETPPSGRGGLGGEPGQGVRDSPPEPAKTRTAQDDAELKKWPPYSGKPVSEVHWDDARRFAAPLLSQAEKLTIQAIGFTGRGLSRLARALEERREKRGDG